MKISPNSVQIDQKIKSEVLPQPYNVPSHNVTERLVSSAQQVKLTLHPSLIKMIVFDLDGTLVDSMDGFSIVAQNIMHQYFGVSKTEAARLYKKTSGLPFEFQLKAIFGENPNIVEAAEKYESQKQINYESSQFYYDVIRVLPLLKQYGYKIAVSSNNHIENVERKVSAYRDCFDMVLGYRKGFLKGRDHFNQMMQDYNFTASQILFVGDSLHDLKEAAANQINFVARLGTFTAKDFDGLNMAHHKVTNLFELIHLLQDI